MRVQKGTGKDVKLQRELSYRRRPVDRPLFLILLSVSVHQKSLILAKWEAKDLPVTYADASEDKNVTAPMRSSGWPIFP